MIKRITKGTLFAGAVLGVLLLLWSADFLISWTTENAVWDITPDKRYSLSRETKEFLAKNNTDISIRLYVSNDLASKNPEWGAYALYIKKLLEEYRHNGFGRISLTVTEVLPFTNTQIAAEKAGVTELKNPNGEKYMYLGASFTNSWGETLSINGFYPKRQKDVEDDITRLLSILASGTKRAVGIISPFFDISKTANPLDNATNWPFINQLRAAGFKVVPIGEAQPYIPRSLDAVLVYYPLKLDRAGLYALDQYLMHGGKIIMMADVFSEERFRKKDVFVTYQSGVHELLNKMGLDYAEDILVGDNINSRPIMLDGKMTKYPFLITVGQDQMAPHSITKGLTNLTLDYAGLLDYKPQKNLKATILFSTGENSGAMQSHKIAEESDEALLKSYYATEGKYPLAVLLEGRFTSIFDSPISENPKLLDALPVFLTTGIKEGKFLFVADADMALESLWNKSDLSGIYETEFASDNMRFIRNAVDYMTNSPYASVPAKQDNQSQSLAAAFYHQAMSIFAPSQIENAGKLAEIKKKILLKKEAMAAAEILSLQQAKEIEELQRQEEKLREESALLTYMAKEEYEKAVSGFAQGIIIICPIGIVLLLAGIYKLYQSRVSARIKGIKND